MSIAVIQIVAIKEKDNDLESTENFLSCPDVITISGFFAIDKLLQPHLLIVIIFSMTKMDDYLLLGFLSSQSLNNWINGSMETNHFEF